MFKTISIKSNLYPNNLKTTIKPPEEIHYLGEYYPISELNENLAVAIVGSRAISDYAKKVIEKVIKDLVPIKPVIVSGYMYGCDYYAHYYALKYGLKTVAVLPCGVSTRLIRHEPEIYDLILENGCFISEYPADTHPNKWDFVLRNRIIVGLVKKVLVIEAAPSSGSLTTADYAFKTNRELYTIPNSIFNNNFKGCYQIFTQGAKFIVGGQDLFTNIVLPKPITEELQVLVGLIEQGKSDIAELANISGLEISELTQKLTKLIDLGYLKSEDGINYHIL